MSINDRNTYGTIANALLSSRDIGPYIRALELELCIGADGRKQWNFVVRYVTRPDARLRHAAMVISKPDPVFTATDAQNLMWMIAQDINTSRDDKEIRDDKPEAESDEERSDDSISGDPLAR